MKTLAIITSKVILTCTILFSCSNNSVLAYEELSFSKKQIESLIAGINSENTDVKKCSIYLAGRYKIKETIEALVNLLESETDPSVIFLIAISLYQIDEEQAIMTVLDFAIGSEDEGLNELLRSAASALANDNYHSQNQVGLRGLH